MLEQNKKQSIITYVKEHYWDILIWGIIAFFAILYVSLVFNYNISTDIDENNCYTVKNGICQVNIDIQCLTATTIHNIFNETLPTPYVGKYMASISSLYSDYTNTNASYRPITLVIYDNLTILYGGTVGGRYFGSFSYPVADDWQP